MRQLRLSEKDITRQISDYLKHLKVFHWKQYQVLGSTLGIPDIIGIMPDGSGRALMIEVKTERGIVSDHQKRVLENSRELGAIAFVARSLEDVVEKLSFLPQQEHFIFQNFKVGGTD